jgi:hypothetical protein
MDPTSTLIAEQKELNINRPEKKMAEPHFNLINFISASYNKSIRLEHLRPFRPIKLFDFS